MKKIVLLGPNGQVGWELQRSLAPIGDICALGREQADFREPDLLRARIRECSPDVIVNAAAYTAVDQAESEPAVAMKVNAEAVGVLAEEARKLGALLVHYSTDYVFDGSKETGYTEDDKPRPLSVYGRTKLAGELAIQASGCRHLVLRTSWVYGAHGNNFAKKIIRLACDREDLKVVDDQVGAPTSSELLADVAALCISLCSRWPQRYPGGLYHLAASGETSWHAYAQFVIETTRRYGVPLRMCPDSIKPISSSEYPTPAERPLNSRLITKKIAAAFGVRLPHWKTHLSRFVAEFSTTIQSR